MRWFLRLTCAATLSVAFIGLLTWAGWPTVRYVFPFPSLDDQTRLHDGWQTVANANTGHIGRDDDLRTPWVGYVATDYRVVPHGENPTVRREFWFYNPQDGRVTGQWDGRDVTWFAWDYRGAAIVSRQAFAAKPGPVTIERFDPETRVLTPVAEGRDADFLLSGDGTTLLTFTARSPTPNWEDFGQPGDLDFVCYDLTTDPPTPSRLDAVVPGGQVREGQIRGTLNGTETVFHTSRHVGAVLGGIAISPDGRRVAMAETWAGGELASPPGVSLYDTRTGQLLGRFTDYGPPSPPGPIGAVKGAYRLVFSPDSRFLRLSRHPGNSHRLPAWHRPDDRHEPIALRRVIDVATGAFVPEPHPAYVVERGGMWSGTPKYAVRTDDGSRNVEAENPADGASRLRVVGRDGEELCPWRPTPPGFPLYAWGTAYACFVPGSTALVWLDSTAAPEPTWLVTLRKWLRRPATPARRVVWYDWAADDLRTVCRLPPSNPRGETVTIGAQPGRVTVFRRSPNDGPDATLEVWDLPPRRPWAWSVPAGVVLGLLATVGGTRLWGRVTAHPSRSQTTISPRLPAATAASPSGVTASRSTPPMPQS